MVSTDEPGNDGDHDPEPFAAVPADRRLPSLVSLSPTTRRQVLRAFFGRWPGHAGGLGLGLGRAVADFQDWEIDSGRIAVSGGSRWWAAVNGMLVVDLADVARPSPPAGDGPGVAAWRRYVAVATAEPGTAEAQRAMWAAHQVSVTEGARTAEELLDHEDGTERRFARLVLSVVEGAAGAGTDTTTDQLATLTGLHYPQRYPADAATIDALVETLSGGPRRGRDQSGSR